MPPLPEGFEMIYIDEDTLRAFEPDARAVAHGAGIHLLRDRELAAVVTKADMVVGALWTANDSGSYTFDIAVDAAQRRQGIGAALIDRGLRIGAELREAGLVMELQVISPESRRLLERRGLVLTGSYVGGVTMGRDEEIDSRMER